MATDFPSAVDDLHDPEVGDTLETAGHISIEKNQNDAIEAIETKIGKDSATDNTSLDYILKSPVGGHDHDGSDSKLLPFLGASAYLASTLGTTVDSVWTKVALDTEAYDVGANFASNKFTAPVNGYYHIDASVHFANMVADKTIGVAIYVDGVLVKKTITALGTITSGDAFVSDTIYLAAESYVELYYYHSAGATTPDVVGGASETFLTIALLKETT